MHVLFFFFSSRRRHTRLQGDWSSDVCSSDLVPGGLLERVLVAYQKQGVSEDMLEKLSQDSPLGQVLASGLRNYKSSRDVMKDAIEEAGSAVAHELERFLTTLGTIATISPLMGLFGTVVGMIEIFG